MWTQLLLNSDALLLHSSWYLWQDGLKKKEKKKVDEGWKEEEEGERRDKMKTEKKEKGEPVVEKGALMMH